MKQTIGLAQFREAFQIRKDSFTYEGLEALFNHFEEYEEDGGDEIELDPIGFCCEYTEYENLAEFHNDYDKEEYPDIDKIEEHTSVIPFGEGSFIIQAF